MLFPTAIHSAPAGHAPRAVSMPVISRFSPLLLRHGGDCDRRDRTWIWRTGWRQACPAPAFPRFSALSGGRLHCSSSPLSESVLLQLFFSKEIDIVFMSE